ncbi:MAG: macro domain-containing protein [Elusimicrobiota bacterium]
MVEVRLKNTKIELLQGDITALDVEVILSPVDKNLSMDRGLASVIKKIGGAEIEKEAVLKAPAEMGGVLVTSAGSLLAKYVFHLVIIEKKYIEREVLRKALQGAFQLADAYQLKLMAVPFLGSPVAKSPADAFARLMLEETVLFIQQHETGLEKIIFCLYNKEFYKYFEDQLNFLRQTYFF